VRPRLLDLFCGAGGCTKGYQRAGFYVVGVDIEPQPRYCGDEFRQMNALAVLRALIADGALATGSGRMRTLEWFNAIHASPPCQAHSTIAKQVRKTGNLGRVDPAEYELDHPDLVAPTRELLVATGLPYVIENVPGAPLIEPVTICGSSVGIDVRRHRIFETNWPLMVPPCAHGWQTPRFRSLDQRRGPKSVVPVHGNSQLASVVGVHGNLNYAGEMELRKKAMEIDWMNNYELTQAIPPAYTELIGHQLIGHLKARAA
jgi:DNA (cytosine-5)-methyltransferase 1